MNTITLPTEVVRTLVDLADPKIFTTPRTAAALNTAQLALEAADAATYYTQEFPS